MLEITVNIPGLEGLVEALKGLAVSTPVSELLVAEAVQPLQAPPVQQTAPPITVPLDQQDSMVPPVAVPLAQPMQQPIQAPPVGMGIPTSDVNYTNEQLAVAMTSLVDAGKMDAVRALLNRFNAPSLMQLPKEMYGAFANELRVLGAKL